MIVPVTDGLLVTLIVQLAPAASEPIQLLVWMNGGEVETLVIVAGNPPELCRVMDVEAEVAPTTTFPKLIVDGDSVSVGGVTPTPLRGVGLGDPAAFVATDKVAFSVPEPAG